MRFEKSVTILYAADVARSLQYYTEKLGFEQQWAWDEQATFGGVVKDDVEIFFCRQDMGHPGTWLCVMVDDVDAYFEQIKTAGAAILEPPVSREWNIREMLVEDPDGHRIRFGHRIECD